MGKWVANTDLDLVLDQIALATDEAILSQDPVRWQHAYWPSSIWALATVYVAGDYVRPSTDNDFIYECTIGGTSAGTEPVWPVVEDDTVADNTVTWLAHENYVLARSAVVPGDFVKSDIAGGRNLNVAAVPNVLVVRTGIPATVAFHIFGVGPITAYTNTRTAIIVNNQIVYPDISARNTVYAFGDRVFATEISTTYFECLIAGTSGGSAPTWGTVQDEQFADGGVTWRTQIAVATLTSGTTVDFLEVDFTSTVV